jgi:magnesium transporter
MPIVASMGGVAGSQTLTVVIRGMALGQIERGNISWLLSKEFAVGIVNGLLYALLVGCIVSIWFQDARMAVIIGLAMAINLIAAALTGTILPVILRSLKIDPALAGSVILTTITDIVGFVSFLGLAAVFLV